LPQLQQPLTELSLVVTGDVVLVFGNGTAFEALTGQEWVFPVAELARDIEQSSPTSIHSPVQGELFSVQESHQKRSLRLAHTGGAG